MASFQLVVVVVFELTESKSASADLPLIRFLSPRLVNFDPLTATRALTQTAYLTWRLIIGRLGASSLKDNSRPSFVLSECPLSHSGEYI
jgi:hypothetical protein